MKEILKHLPLDKRMVFLTRFLDSFIGHPVETKEKEDRMILIANILEDMFKE